MMSTDVNLNGPGLAPLIPTVEFKGEESVSKWEKSMENMLIEIDNATDKAGLKIIYNKELTILMKNFMLITDQVRDNMNNGKGDPCTLIPRGY